MPGIWPRVQGFDKALTALTSKQYSSPSCLRILVGESTEEELDRLRASGARAKWAWAAAASGAKYLLSQVQAHQDMLLDSGKKVAFAVCCGGHKAETVKLLHFDIPDVAVPVSLVTTNC